MKYIEKSILLAILIFIGISQKSRAQDDSGIACNCVSFGLTGGQTYLVSAWVKEDDPAQVISYSHAQLEINFSDIVDTPIASFNFSPSGRIIDGWQQISGRFTVPIDYYNIDFILGSTDPNIDVYFDDFRIHPYLANMKSYVYDPVTLRLMAELDENNYATFYEYDMEGGLVRVKKETEEGVYTIQETRSKTAIHP